MKCSSPCSRRIVIRFVLGTEHRANVREYQASYDEIEPRVYYLDRDDTSTVLGVFGQAEAKLRDDFSLTAGLRYDYYGETIGGTTNPRFAAIYNPSPNSAIKALYGEAFRAPNPYERHYNPEQANRPPLRPETIETYELVYEHYFNSTYRLSLSGYSYHIDGLITQAETADAEPYYDNLDDVHARGVELELEGSYKNGTVLRGSWTVQRAKDIATNLELTNSPRQLGKLSASMPVLNSKVFANLELQYNSDSADAGADAQPFVLDHELHVELARPVVEGRADRRHLQCLRRGTSVPRLRRARADACYSRKVVLTAPRSSFDSESRRRSSGRRT